MRFVLLDQLISLVPGKTAQGRMSFSPELEIFADHFPGQPIVPGVLLTETMCQTAGWLIVASREFAGWPLLVRIDRANFRRLVRAGDTLEITASLTADRQDVFEVLADVRVNGDVVADTRLLFKLFDFDHGADTAATFATWGRETFERLKGPAALAPVGR